MLVADRSCRRKRCTSSIAYAKANPGKLNFGSPGYGTPPHLIGELFKQRAGIDIVHVPYKGTAASLTDMMAGQVQIVLRRHRRVADPARSARASSGRSPPPARRATRAARRADHDRKRRAGFRRRPSFIGVVAPAGTPPAIVGKLNAAINAGLQSPEVSATCAGSALELRPARREEFGAFLVRENQKWTEVVRQRRHQGGLKTALPRPHPTRIVAQAATQTAPKLEGGSHDRQTDAARDRHRAWSGVRRRPRHKRQRAILSGQADQDDRAVPAGRADRHHGAAHRPVHDRQASASR